MAKRKKKETLTTKMNRVAKERDEYKRLLDGYIKTLKISLLFGEGQDNPVLASTSGEVIDYDPELEYYLIDGINYKKSNHDLLMQAYLRANDRYQKKDYLHALYAINDCYYLIGYGLATEKNEDVRSDYLFIKTRSFVLAEMIHSAMLEEE